MGNQDSHSRSGQNDPAPALNFELKSSKAFEIAKETAPDKF
jgi:hypothetical protein